MYKTKSSFFTYEFQPSVPPVEAFRKRFSSRIPLAAYKTSLPENKENISFRISSIFRAETKYVSECFFTHLQQKKTPLQPSLASSSHFGRDDIEACCNGEAAGFKEAGYKDTVPTFLKFWRCHVGTSLYQTF